MGERPSAAAQRAQRVEHAGEVVELTTMGTIHRESWRWQDVARSEADERSLKQRRKLAVAMLAHASGLRNCDYLLNAAAAIQRHWHFCDASAQAHLTTVS